MFDPHGVPPSLGNFDAMEYPRKLVLLDPRAMEMERVLDTVAILAKFYVGDLIASGHYDHLPETVVLDPKESAMLGTIGNFLVSCSGCRKKLAVVEQMFDHAEMKERLPSHIYLGLKAGEPVPVAIRPPAESGGADVAAVTD